MRLLFLDKYCPGSFRPMLHWLQTVPEHTVYFMSEYRRKDFVALPGFPWVADLLMSFPEGTNEGYGPIFSDSGADRALVC